MIGKQHHGQQLRALISLSQCDSNILNLIQEKHFCASFDTAGGITFNEGGKKVREQGSITKRNVECSK